MKPEHGETKQLQCVQLTKCTQKSLHLPWKGDAGWALSGLHRPSKEENMPVMGHGGHMDKPRFLGDTLAFLEEDQREMPPESVVREKRLSHLLRNVFCHGRRGCEKGRVNDTKI